MFEKDYSLLRPFDLEAAKAGAEVVFVPPSHSSMAEYNGDTGKLLAGPNDKGEIVFDFKKFGMDITKTGETDEFRMAPLAWVEGKPVYKGDALYWVTEGRRFEVSYHIFDQGQHWLVGVDTYKYKPGNLTWNPPKVKREGWVNVYRSGNSEWAACSSVAYVSREKADRAANPYRIACVRIEWEE